MMAEAMGYMIGVLIIFAIIVASFFLIAIAPNNFLAGAVGFGTALLFELIKRRCNLASIPGYPRI